MADATSTWQCAATMSSPAALANGKYLRSRPGSSLHNAWNRADVSNITFALPAPFALGHMMSHGAGG
jgi:hypothetical protein